jgi:calcineurin-like phosphoesterase family protein
MNIWFYSDPHFGHKSVIRKCRRPFYDLEDMRESFIERWNSRVDSDDVVYCLGDMFFCGTTEAKAIMDRLHGTKVLIRGNHDRDARKMRRLGFAAVVEHSHIEIAGQLVALSHYPYWPLWWERALERLLNFWKWWLKLKYREQRYPERRLSDEGGWIIHGHVHEAWRVRRKMINVGVDV